MIKSTGPNSNEFVKNVMEQVSSLVEVTYGPSGGFVVLSNGNTSLATKDGVSVIRALVSNDDLEQAVISVIQEAALNTLSKAGDGTTTTIVLANQLLKSFSTYDYMKKEEIIKSVKEEIRKKSKPVTIGSDALTSIAMTSTSGDKSLAKTVLEAFTIAESHGISGVIAEPHLGRCTSVDTVDGISFTGNMIDTIFYDSQELRTKSAIDPHIIFAMDEVSGEDDIVELITTCVNKGVEDLIIIAPSFAMTSLSALSINHKVSMNLMPIAVDGGDAVRTKMAIQAIATALGATIVGEESGVSIGDVSEDMIIPVGKISISGKSVVVSGYDNSSKESINELVNRYESKLRAVASDEERDMIKTLISILKKKMVKVIVGGHTLNSITERKDRADDCINSVELALKGGVVPGAGRAYTNMGIGINTGTNIDKAVEAVSRIINKGEVSPTALQTLDPTIVAEIVAEQAIELAFMLGMTRAVVLTQ